MKRLLSMLASAILVLLSAALASELATRAFISHLALPVLVYLNTGLKDEIPSVMEAIKRKYPNLYEFKEIDDENWTFEPGSETSGETPDGEPFRSRVTADGFLTPDDPPIPSRQLIVIGDSCVAKRSPHSIPALIRERVDIPVYALAVPNWGPSNYLDAYARFGATRNAPVVAVFSFENDFGDAQNYETWKASGTKLSFLRYIASRSWLPGSIIETTNTGDRFLDRHSVVWNWLKFALIRARPRKLAMLQSDRTETFPGQVGGTSFQLLMRPDTSRLEAESSAYLPGGSRRAWVDPYFKMMSRLVAEVRRSGRQIIIFWIPSKERVYLPLLDPARRSKYIRSAAAELDAYDRALKEFGEAEKVQVVNFTPDLIAHARNGEQLFYSFDLHPNGRADRIMAGIAAERIRAALK